MLQSKIPLRYLPMTEMAKYRQSGMTPPDSIYGVVPTDTLVPALLLTLYETNGASFVLKGIIEHAEQKKIPSGDKKRGTDILTLKVTDGTNSKVVALEGGLGKIPTQKTFELGGLNYQFSYGSVMFKIPFKKNKVLLFERERPCLKLYFVCFQYYLIITFLVVDIAPLFILTKYNP